MTDDYKFYYYQPGKDAPIPFKIVADDDLMVYEEVMAMLNFANPKVRYVHG